MCTLFSLLINLVCIFLLLGQVGLNAFSVVNDLGLFSCCRGSLHLNCGKAECCVSMGYIRQSFVTKSKIKCVACA